MNIDYKLIRDHEGKLDISCIESVDGVFWRTSQHKTLQEARQAGAFRYTDECYGYSNALDMLISMRRLADLMDHDSSQNDIMIQLTINNEVQEPCYLAQASSMIEMYLIKKECIDA